MVVYFVDGQFVIYFYFYCQTAISQKELIIEIGNNCFCLIFQQAENEGGRVKSARLAIKKREKLT